MIGSANPTFFQLFERDESNSIGYLISDILPDVEIGNETDALFVQFTTPSGKELLLKVQYISWLDSDGSRKYVATFDDITDEQSATTDLRETERRFNLALGVAKAGVFDIDLETGLSVVSPSWFALMQIDPYAVGVNPQEEFMKRIHPDDVSIMLDADRQCIEGKTSHSKSEFRIAVSKGEWRWLRSNAAVAARDSSGRATRFVGVQADVTALRFANDALKSSREQFQNIV